MAPGKVQKKCSELMQCRAVRICLKVVGLYFLYAVLSCLRAVSSGSMSTSSVFLASLLPTLTLGARRDDELVVLNEQSEEQDSAMQQQLERIIMESDSPSEALDKMQRALGGTNQLGYDFKSAKESAFAVYYDDKPKHIQRKVVDVGLVAESVYTFPLKENGINVAGANVEIPISKVMKGTYMKRKHVGARFTEFGRITAAVGPNTMSVFGDKISVGFIEKHLATEREEHRANEVNDAKTEEMSMGEMNKKGVQEGERERERERERETTTDTTSTLAPFNADQVQAAFKALKWLFAYVGFIRFDAFLLAGLDETYLRHSRESRVDFDKATASAAIETLALHPTFNEEVVASYTSCYHLEAGRDTIKDTIWVVPTEAAGILSFRGEMQSPPKEILSIFTGFTHFAIKGNNLIVYFACTSTSNVPHASMRSEEQDSVTDPRYYVGPPDGRTWKTSESESKNNDFRWALVPWKPLQWMARAALAYVSYHPVDEGLWEATKAVRACSEARQTEFYSLLDKLGDMSKLVTHSIIEKCPFYQDLSVMSSTMRGCGNVPFLGFEVLNAFATSAECSLKYVRNFKSEGVKQTFGIFEAATWSHYLMEAPKQGMFELVMNEWGQ